MNIVGTTRLIQIIIYGGKIKFLRSALFIGYKFGYRATATPARPEVKIIIIAPYRRLY